MRRLFCFLALAVLCACGGGGGASHGTVPNVPTGGQYASVTISLQVPAPASHAGARPAYVSPATQSVGVSVDSGSVTYTNLAPNSAACPGSANYPLNCTVTITAPVGTHTLTFTTYDQPQSGNPSTPAGNLLSQNSIGNINFTATGTPNIPVVLQGVPATLEVSFVGSNSTLENGMLYFSRDASQQLNATFNVITADAAGNLIIGPGAPAISVSLTGVPSYVGASVSPANTQGQYVLHAANYESIYDTPGTFTITATPGGGGTPLSASYKPVPAANVKTFAGQYAQSGAVAGVGANAQLPLVSTLPFLVGDGSAVPLLMKTATCQFTLVTTAAAVTYPSNTCPNVSNEFAFSTATAVGATSIAYEATDTSTNCYLMSYDVALQTQQQLTAPQPCINPYGASPGAASQPAASATLEDNLLPAADINYGGTKGLFFLAYYGTTNKWYLREYDPATQTMNYVGQADYGTAAAGALQPYNSASPSTALLQNVAGSPTSDGHVMYAYSTGCIVSIDPAGLTISVLAGQCGTAVDDIDEIGTAARVNGVLGMTLGNGQLYFTEGYTYNNYVTDSLRVLDLGTGRVTTLAHQQFLNAGGTRRNAARVTHPTQLQRLGTTSSGDYLSPGDDFAPNVSWPYVNSLRYIPSRNSLLFPDTGSYTIREVIL